MRSANFVSETTTSIAGASGNGAVTLTQITSVPRFSTVFGTQATTVRYVIEDTVNKKFESGIGSVASNVLTRTRPQITWDGSTWDDSTPSPIAFGSTPTSGNVVVRISALAESLGVTLPGANSTIAGDPTWRDYPITNAAVWDNNGTGEALTADREYYSAYRLDLGGQLNGIQFELTTQQASSGMKMALYSCGHNGLPGAKIVDFNTTATTATGIKTDTATGTWSPSGPVWLSPGWYFVGFMSGHAIGIRGLSSLGADIQRTPVGRHSGYGWGNTVWVAGSYATGLPSSPSPATMITSSNPLSVPWFGLKVVS